MPFEIGKSYTRRDIHNAIGGSMQAYLPTVGGEIVCVCLRHDDNPEAPRVVLVGSGPQVLETGRKLSKKRDPLPVFLKHRPDDWRYAGMFKTSGSTTDLKTIQEHEKRAGRTGVRMIVYLDPV
ncbi:MAG: hypothetical protein R8L07_20510 [Alphaproteobacteria bacterium]|nr:hypothetical protein [Alphaproteobacteria bacterium]